MSPITIARNCTDATNVSILTTVKTTQMSPTASTQLKTQMAPAP